jgi:hypothetical protein
MAISKTISPDTTSKGTKNIVFEEGIAGEKYVDGRLGIWKPCVVYGDSELGVGLLDYDGHHSYSWGLMSPKEPITCFRAMKLAELAMRININPGLANLYRAARRLSAAETGKSLELQTPDIIQSSVSARVLERLKSLNRKREAKEQKTITVEEQNPISFMLPGDLNHYLDMLRTEVFWGETAAFELKREIARGVLRETPEVKAFLAWAKEELQ